MCFIPRQTGRLSVGRNIRLRFSGSSVEISEQEISVERELPLQNLHSKVNKKLLEDFKVI
jgi:hypothetical protein